MITTEQKIMAILAHLGYLVGGISLIIVPLIMYLWKKDDYFVADHSKQALVAQTAVALLGVVISALTMIFIGVLLMPVLAVVYLILLVTSIIAAYKAFQGESYKYPFIQDVVEKF